ncbi:hypothetical protein JX265_000630 [Neoarthrinium moseri]|uniref:Uncharacterized protein n=1 Tax=Neoarthrinium moseri TaxID=1658444 RepID=A0A9P9WZ41_9PEZI|nr:uncharacterized protein JN550_001618 [Neoarthrinium moseri]KAI1854225.1 hypothetical protein JX266_001366 [Neoarthrinium moseri]KAI1876122.1 hypothetical protein JN550_001618 [Neoarthrinium moseri]KAI1881804.1 hypothetical protein JX265_000630 [Neoarthrinium moseri]
MESLLKRAAAFPHWSKVPIPNFTLSAGGLIALADLGTIAQRTAITGGSSWLDSLLLAPGLHYQQAADALADESARFDAVEQIQGKTSTYSIVNPATVRYLQKVGRQGEIVTVDVGMLPQRQYFRRARQGQRRGQRATIWRDSGSDLGWFSHLLYLASPVLTVTAIVFLVLLQEWWGIALLVALMLSRVLNIWVIKQRSQPPKPLPPDPDVSHMLTQYLVDLGNGRSVCLRGMADDLQAITTSSWLRTKTHIDGYLEAMAKLIVYVVASFSGNMSQVGNIIFMGLLLITAGLLGLSNAHAKTFQMHGRLAAPTSERLPYPPDKPPYPQSRENFGSSGSVSFPATTPRTDTGLTAMTDWAEKGQVGAPLRESYPFGHHVDYQ